MGFLPGMLTFLQVCLFLWGWGRVQAGLTSSLVAVMRTQGSLRLILNTKLWAQMQMDKASEKSIRITAMDTEDQGVKVFLISVSSPGHRPGGCQTQAGALHRGLARESREASRVRRAGLLVGSVTPWEDKPCACRSSSLLLSGPVEEGGQAPHSRVLSWGLR